MRDRKYRFVLYSLYDPDGIRCRLEAMARKGWLLDGIFLSVWRYRRIEPRALPFTVVYDPEIGPYDPDPTPDDPLAALCAHSGWTLAASTGPVQIYYSRQPNPVPIETDPVVMVENMHRMAKKTLLPTCCLFFVLAILGLAMGLNSLFTSTVAFLASGMDLSLLLCGVIFLPLSLGVLAAYYRWRNKALAAAAQGAFLPAKGRPWATLCLWLTAPFLFFGWMAMDSTVQSFYDFFRAAAIIFLCVLVEEVMRKKRVHRDRIRDVTILLCILLSVGLAIGEGTGLVDQLDRKYSLHGWQAHPPLVLADLKVEAAEDDLFCTGDRSPLLGQFALWEGLGQGEAAYFQYHIAQVKCPALYGLCREKQLGDRPREDSPSQPWGAQWAYRFTQAVTPHTYLLGYSDVMVEVSFPWAPTPAQMALVGERLGAIRL